MGWRGTLRSINAAANRAERASIKRNNELKREYARVSKMRERERSEHEVMAYENLIERLVSVHKDCSDLIPWAEYANASEPEVPNHSDAREKVAQKALDEYVPTFWQKVFFRVTSTKKKLAENVLLGRELDVVAFEKQKEFYENWKSKRDLAQRVLSGDEKAYFEAIEDLNPLSEIAELGSSALFNSYDSKTLLVTLNVKGKEVVPREAKTLLKSGKISVKTIPDSKFYEIYQDYVCSCILRIANETFSMLPVEKVLVNAKENLLNPKTGHLENQTILSVLIPRKTLESINLSSIDPSRSLEMFVHRMSFKKTEGFEPVAALDVSELGAA